MIARLLLLLAAWFGVTEAIDGLKVNLRYSGPPDFVSLAEIQTAEQTLPRFVHIEQAEFGEAMCFRRTWSKGEEKISSNESYVPLLDTTQSERLLHGGTAIAGVFAKMSDCESAPSPSLFQGILSKDSIDTTIREKFKESNIVIGDHPLLISPMYAPPSSVSNGLLLCVSLLAGVAAIAPFFKREKWPKEKELEGRPLPELLEMLHPAIEVNTGDWKLHPGTFDTPEVVLLKFNCVNSSKRPSLAVLTNKRYLLYRTNIQFGLILLKTIEHGLDKIPVLGGIASMLVEPFEESYEIIFSPESKRFHEVMGYDDRAILAGKVPWHKTCEVALADIPKRAGSLRIEKKFWSEGISVLFIPDSFKGLLKTPSDFALIQETLFLPVGKLVEALKPALAAYGCVVQQDEKKIDISWKHSTGK